MPALIVDPALIAAVTRQFNLRGALQPFNLTENVVPTFDIGKLTGLDPIPQQVVTPGLASTVRIGTVGNNHVRVGFSEFAPANVISSIDVAPAAGTVLADSGQLAAGTNYFQALMSHDDSVDVHIELQWRNAANAANVAAWPIFIQQRWEHWFMINNALNERIRWVNIGAVAGTALSVVAFDSTGVAATI